MASKYAGIIDKLPRDFGQEPDFQEKVDAIKKQILEAPAGNMLDSDVLEDLVMEVTALQSVINDMLIKGVAGHRNAPNIARLYTDVRKLKNAFSSQEKTTNVLVEAYEQLLVEQYEVEGLSSLKLEDGASVRVQYEPHGKVIDKEANRKWAQENGLENLLCLPWQTVNALTKEALLAGEKEPAGVEATSRPKAVYTKA